MKSITNFLTEILFILSIVKFSEEAYDALTEDAFTVPYICISLSVIIELVAELK